MVCRRRRRRLLSEAVCHLFFSSSFKLQTQRQPQQFDGKTKSWNERTQKANKKDKQANENLKTKKESNDKAQRDLGIKTEERADALSSAKDERLPEF